LAGGNEGRGRLSGVMQDGGQVHCQVLGAAHPFTLSVYLSAIREYRPGMSPGQDCLAVMQAVTADLAHGFPELVAVTARKKGFVVSPRPVRCSHIAGLSERGNQAAGDAR
jgi:hypothetical protein